MPGRTDQAQTAEDYTGHELDDETGLHYAGARYYMSALGRWTTVDPLADDFPSVSPYNYSMNNPVKLVDPDGRAPQSCCFLIPPLGLAEAPDNVAAMAGNKEAQARVAKRAGARLGITSLFLPGPEDVLLGAAAMKAGRAIAKYGDEAVGFVKGLFKGSDEVAGATEEVRQAQKGIRSLKKRAAEHEKKLKDYAQNPDAHDNQGKLKDVPKEIRKKIIKGRKRKLRKEINTFRQNIRKLRRKIRDLKEE